MVTLTPRWTSLTSMFVFSLKFAFRILPRLFFTMIRAFFSEFLSYVPANFAGSKVERPGFYNTFATCRVTLVVKSQGRLLDVSSETAIAVSSRATLAAKSQGRSSLYGVICTFMLLKCRTIVSEGCPMCPKSSTVASYGRAECHFMM